MELKSRENFLQRLKIDDFFAYSKKSRLFYHPLIQSDEILNYDRIFHS